MKRWRLSASTMRSASTRCELKASKLTWCMFAYTSKTSWRLCEHHSFLGRHRHVKSACPRRPILTRFPRIPSSIRWDDGASQLGNKPKPHKRLLVSCSYLILPSRNPLNRRPHSTFRVWWRKKLLSGPQTAIHHGPHPVSPLQPSTR